MSKKSLGEIFLFAVFLLILMILEYFTSFETTVMFGIATIIAKLVVMEVDNE